jgi:hypothetical protein
MPEITDWRRRKDRYLFKGYKCTSCGKIYNVKRFRCLNCRSESFEQISLPREGILLYYSIVRTAPKRFGKYTPYVLGLIRLNNGLNILSQVVDVSLEELKSGLKLEAVFRILYEYGRSGHIIYGTKFRPKIT